ncbi:hypothetical protein LOY41_12180 [Pseudomonas atacamensis]|uniref:hypothetical protein n=1 Tax=Pseudomonas atacamensis TaxID=2565368 RepID=UPI0021600724|nr:hypothetical protein [Pseudomonas atacamensis]UVM02007.1 hypothetical protein LOY41_12180 [Pseudomonas atacamensis]
MNIVNHCLTAYSKGDAALRNGIPASEENVVQMLEVIRTVLREAGASSPELTSLTMSKESAFNKDNPADLIALAFDALTDQNRNPALWTELEGRSIRSEILSTISTMLSGPNVLAPDQRRGVNAEDYAEAKTQLISLLSKRYSQFGL